MKERQFHGDSLGQGKRPGQYENSGKAFVWAFAFLVIAIVAAIILSI